MGKKIILITPTKMPTFVKYTLVFILGTVFGNIWIYYVSILAIDHLFNGQEKIITFKTRIGDLNAYLARII